jgi:hypothetical protein
LIQFVIALVGAGIAFLGMGGYSAYSEELEVPISAGLCSNALTKMESQPNPEIRKDLTEARKISCKCKNGRHHVQYRPFLIASKFPLTEASLFS